MAYVTTAYVPHRMLTAYILHRMLTAYIRHCMHTQDEEGEDDEEFIDIDTEEIFTALAKGKEFLTFADLKEWDLLKEMKEAGDMSDSQLRDILKAAGKYTAYLHCVCVFILLISCI
jgi:hypothetical protein